MRPRLSPPRSPGQTLVLFLVFAAACVATLLIVFNVGQVTSEKEKLVNTADAAAYSAAITEARTLNFESYINRGVVANEVIIAQVVSFDSWVNYLDSVAQNIATVTSWIPYVDVVTSDIAEVAGEADQVVDEISQPAVTAENILAYTVLPKIVTGAHYATYDAAYAALNQVIAQNVTTFNSRSDTAAYLTKGGTFALIPNAKNWQNFTTVPGTPAVAAQVISDSRDGFSITRQPAAWPLEFTIPLLARGHKHGSTVLSSNYSRWDAQDQYVFGTFYPTKHCPLGCWHDAPLAEGDASASQDGTSSGSPFSRAWFAKTNDMSGFSGIPALRDIADRKALTENTPGHALALDFLVEVGKDDSNIKTSSNTGMGVGTQNVQESLAANHVTAASAARVYFQRPDSSADTTGSALFRSDAGRNGYIEYGSVYSPYWQVKLIPVSSGQKAMLAGLDGAGVSAVGISAEGFTP